jgi:hypothetical protein
MTGYSLALGIFALLAAPASAKTSEYPPDPEVLLCPPTSGDLDYALDRTMTAGKFQEDPHGGLDTWRHRAEGSFHVLSLEQAQWLSVHFKRFDTAAGTRLVAELRWQTSSYEFGVKQKEPHEAIQQMLDAFGEIFPCIHGKPVRN